MVKQLGAPTFFFILSAADMQWPELFMLLDPSNKLINLSPVEQRKARARLLNENPLVAAWFFQIRVDLFFRHFLTPEFKVVDHWYRFEWQNRGSGHVHGFLWLKDSPGVIHIGTNEEERRKVIEYFDQFVCTMNPDPHVSIVEQQHPCSRLVLLDANLEIDDADYSSIVNWVQRHSKCGTYCLRMHKVTKQMVCRFRYPFEISNESKIFEEPPNSGMYRFIGHRNDEYVCSHNRKVSQTWRANIDISAILTPRTVVNYVGKYAAKAEPASKNFTDTLHDVVFDKRRPCQTSRSAFCRFLMKSCSERDVSAQEVMYLLMGYPLAKSSRKTTVLNISEQCLFSSTVRRRRAVEAGDNVGTNPNFFSRYMQRPSEYEELGWHTSRADAIVRVIPEIDGDIPPDSEKWESYCRVHVLLHYHYHSLEEAKGTSETWSHRYIQLGFANQPPNVLPEPIDDELEDDAYDIDLDPLHREDWMIAAEMGDDNNSQQYMDLGLRSMDTTHNWEEGFQKYPLIDIDRRFIHNTVRGGHDSITDVPHTALLVGLDRLSNDQRLAHDLVTTSLQSGVPIRLIICGGAGTGKSTLINAIVRSVTEIFGSNSVRKMAPTGVAAFNIGGSTIHHELALPAGKSMYQPYKPLGMDQARKMQEEFFSTKLIIIDEYSMVGRCMLDHINRRCRDIFGQTDFFGNISVLLVGDMRQLPPVCDSPLYLEHGSRVQQDGTMAYASFDKCIRLSQIFRQAGDDQATFREALLRLSNGSSIMADWNLFKTRDSSVLAPEEWQTFKSALRLLPTREDARQHNINRLVELGRPVAQIRSKNNCNTASNADSDEAKGLDKVIYLSVGARVMLRSNLATHTGLVNGAMGIVTDIVYASGSQPPTELPLAVMVNFDDYSGPRFEGNTNIIPIPPQTANWKTSTGTSCQRVQIPLILSWAITIHKSQGLTLEKAVVDIGARESLGLAFVALSRTRKLCDLALEPMFTFERLEKIKRSSGLVLRLQEEDRLHEMSNHL